MENLLMMIVGRQISQSTNMVKTITDVFVMDCMFLVMIGKFNINADIVRRM